MAPKSLGVKRSVRRSPIVREKAEPVVVDELMLMSRTGCPPRAASSQVSRTRRRQQQLSDAKYASVIPRRSCWKAEALLVGMAAKSNPDRRPRGRLLRRRAGC